MDASNTKQKDGSEIQKFFNDSTVFITGASGFLGKLLLEKLLWSCRDIRKVYVLLRFKKGEDPNKRFLQIFDKPIFQRLKLVNYDYIKKVTFLVGDCLLPNLGLSEKQLEILTKEVDCVFHCAATVRFNNKLKFAANINMRSTRDLLWIAKQMKKLRAFVHVSTAYSHCPHEDIVEEFYPVPLSGNQLLTITDILDDSLLDKITPILLGDWPNTYTFTKALGEDIIKEEGKGLPIAIVRPSIATVKEPMVGWIDNIYGPTGVLLGLSLGAIHTLHSRKYKLADIVPADYVINAMITAAWNIATRSNNNANQTKIGNGVKEVTKFEKDVIIYNYVSSPQKSIDWDTVLKLSAKYSYEIPSPLLTWVSFYNVTANIYLHKLLVYILHFLPAYIMDFIAVALGKKRKFVQNCFRIDKLSDSMTYFSTQDWNFTNKNTQALWKQLKSVDREMFMFDMNNIDWETYFSNYMRGCRVHILKDPLDTVPQGRMKQRKVRIAHYTIISLLTMLLILSVQFLF